MNILKIIVIFITLAGCTPPENELTVGVILHLTNNDYVAQGVAMQEGVELALHDAERLGIKAKVIYEDSQYNIPKAVNSAQKLIEIDHIDAALISTHSEAMSVGPVFEEKKVPLIVLWDSNPDLENLGDYVFAAGAWTPSAGERIAEFALTDLQVKTVALLAHNGEWSQSIKNFFKDYFEENGGKIVSVHDIDPGTSDFRAVITKAIADKPDAIFAPVDNNIGAFFKQLKEAGYSGKVLAADSITQNAIDSSQGGLEGAYYTVFATPKNDRAEEFKREYVEFFKKEPKELIYNAMGYDAMMSILLAAQNGKESESIKNSLYTIKVPGAFAEFSFTSEGSAPKIESVFQVQDGKEVFVKE